MQFEANENVVAGTTLRLRSYSRIIHAANVQLPCTDTIAAMTGALVGAHIGSEFASDFPLNCLEEGEEFIDYLRDVSKRLFNAIK